MFKSFKQGLWIAFSALFVISAVACGNSGNGGGNGDDVDTADEDGDSLAAPAVDNFLSITGLRDFAYSDEISSPDGDEADFVGFEFPNNSNPNQAVDLTLDCDIEGDEDADVRGVIFQNGVETASSIECNEGERTFTVNNTQVQVVRIGFADEPDDDTHVEYTLTVVGFD